MTYLERVLVGLAAATAAAPLAVWLFRRTSAKPVRRRQVMALSVVVVVCGGAVALFPVPLLVPGALLVLLAVPAAAVDAAERRLPERLCWPLTVGSASALGVAALCGAPADRCGQSIVVGLVWGLFLFGLFVLVKHPGPGDAVLAPGLGFVLGWYGWSWVFAAFVLSYVVFGCVGVVATRRQGMPLRERRMALGPSLVATTVVLSTVAAVLPS